MLTDQTKNSFNFKKILSRRYTTTNKSWYEEIAGRLVYVSSLEIMADAIPSPPPTTSTDVVEVYDDLILTKDPTVGQNLVWLACETQGDLNTQLVNFIPPRFDSQYFIQVYDDAGTRIYPFFSVNWVFDYENGVLAFENDPVAAGFVAPFHIKAYRYKGTMGVGSSAIQKYAAFLREATQITVTAGNNIVDVSTDMSGKTPGGSETSLGVVTDPPNNLVKVLTYPDRDEIVTDTGSKVYGRLTENSGVWTVSFYYLDETGMEQNYTFNNDTDIIWAYFEVLDFNDWPVFRDDITYPSDQIVGDMPYASNTQSGKVLITNDGEIPSNDYYVISGTDSRIAKLTEWQVKLSVISGVPDQIQVDYKGGVYNLNGDTAPDGSVTVTAATGYFLVYVEGTSGSVYVVSDASAPPTVPDTGFGIYRFEVSLSPTTISNEKDIRPIHVLTTGGSTSAGDSPLGVPTDGDYQDGLLDIDSTTHINDSIDMINRVLKYLAPENADPLTGLDWSANTFYTGKIAHITDFTPNGYFSSGVTTTKITTNTALYPTNANSTTTFRNADQGEIELYINDALSDTFDLAANFNEAERDGNQSYPPATSPNGKIRIDAVGKYNNFPLWQKGDFTLDLPVTTPTDMKVEVRHVYTSTNFESAADVVFVDSNIAPSNIVGPTVSENTPVIKTLSGINYYTTNSTFDLSFSADNLFKHVYVDNFAKITAPGLSDTIVTFGTSGVTSPTTNPPNDVDALTISNLGITLDNPDQYNTDLKFSVELYKPYGSYGPYSESLTTYRLVDTYATGQSDENNETFTDEEYRLPTSYNFDTYADPITGQWNSSAILTNGNLQVAGHRLFYPTIDYTTGYLPTQDVSANYSTFIGDQVYYRAFYDPYSAHSAGYLIIYGMVWNDLLTGMKLEMKLPTQSGWLDLTRPFDIATFTGIDGDGVMVSYYDGANSVTIEWSVGTLSTANSGNRLYIRITFSDTTKVMTGIQETWA